MSVQALLIAALVLAMTQCCDVPNVIASVRKNARQSTIKKAGIMQDSKLLDCFEVSPLAMTRCHGEMGGAIRVAFVVSAEEPKRKEDKAMLKKVSIATFCVVVSSSLAFAAPEAKSENRDLLAAASNNAVSQNSVGAQKLSKAEMEQVEGGKFSLRNLLRPKLPPLCGRLVCIKP